MEEKQVEQHAEYTKPELVTHEPLRDLTATESVVYETTRAG